MGAVLSDATKGLGMRALVFCGVAAVMSLVLYRTSQWIELGSTPHAPPPPGPCLIETDQGYEILDHVDNLETCGARLEAIYLESGLPVSGAYEGFLVFADKAGIDTATEHGPRRTLIAPQMRQWVDSTLANLLAARDRRPALQIGVVRAPG